MKKKNWQVLYKGPLSGFDHEFDFWRNKTTTEKFAEVLSLTEQYMKIKGINPKDASRLLRSTAVLKREKS